MYSSEIKTYGFNTPPLAILDILNSIVFNRDVVIYVSDLLVAPFPYEEIAAREKSNLIVVIYSAEGHAYREFRQTIDRLINECGVLRSNIIIHSSALADSSNSNIKIIPSLSGLIGTSVTGAAVDLNVSYRQYSPTHLYVCLNRLPRWERAAIIQGLHDRKLDHRGKMSYYTVKMDRANDLEVARQAFSPGLRPKIPMILDQKGMSISDGFSISSNYITGALFNIMTESSYEYKNYLEDPHSEAVVSQCSPGITEKTFKTFIMGQIPIFVASKDTVKHTRDLGFDVFDDIVDHSYDSIVDPAARIEAILDQVEVLCNRYSDADLIKLKNKIQLRLEHNVDVLKAYTFNHKRSTAQWVEHFAEIGVVG